MTATMSQLAVKLERTDDVDLLKSIMQQPEIFDGISDDGSVERDKFEPAIHPAVWYVLARAEDRLLGVWMFHPQTSTCWEAHTCLLPDAGSAGVIAARSLPSWIWEKTGCTRIVTSIPRYNRPARFLAINVGMTQYGMNPGAWRKWGMDHDLLLYGISKEGK